jgi:hypothetical protein
MTRTSSKAWNASLALMLLLTGGVMVRRAPAIAAALIVCGVALAVIALKQR